MMRHWLAPLFLVAGVFAGLPAIGQEPAPAIAPTPTATPTPAPTAAPSPAPAMPAPAATPAPTPAEVKPFFRKKTFGLGPGLVFWPPQRDDPTDTWDTAPALSLQTRFAAPLGSVIGFEWTNDVVFHDWKAMGDAYRWFFKEPEPDAEEDWRALKLGLLWPGLLFVPFGAANYATGFGLVVWTGKKVPSMYFDIGLNMALYLRLSDPDFRADFGVGGYGGVGFDLFESVGANIRAMWGTPFIHQLIRDTSGGITTLLFNINFGH